MKHFRCLRQFSIACFIFLALPCTSVAYALDREYVIKAVFLYNFLNYIKWPDTQNISGIPKVKLCIVGRDPFGSALTALKKKVSANWDLEIAHIAIDQPLPEPSCRIVFISHLEPKHITINKSLSSVGVLTVSDIEGFAKNTGIIELVKRKDKIKLIINADRLKQAKLNASSKLMKISEIVESEK